MFLSDASIKRPIAMTTVILVMILLGLLAYRKLGLDLMPQVDVPFVTILVVYPGATPEQMETEVARKIEDAVVAVDGLKHMNTVCMQSVCQILLEFNLDRNVDVAATDVREKIDLIQNDLPQGAERPKIVKFNVNARAVARIALTGDLPPEQLYDYADNELRTRLSTLSGVADIRLTGGNKREVHVLLERSRLSAYGLTSADVIRKLKQGHIKVPAGTVKQGIREYSVLFDAEFPALNQIGNLIIADHGGRRVRLRDVAEIRMGSKEVRTAAFLDGKPCISIQIVKKGEANAVRVVNRVRRAVRELNRRLPGGMHLVWYLDDGDYIASTVRDAWSSILLGVLLTGAILLLFLQDVRSAFIAFLSMPASIVITFWIMGLYGYTFNISTLLALGISVGILVTNSIVVLENIARRRNATSPAEAARTGAGEVAIAVLASALTNVVVFVPIAMMTSLVGRFFVPFAVTITAATLVSLFISFTLTPILAAKLLKTGAGDDHGRGLFAILRLWEKAYQTLERGYAGLLRRTARFAPLYVLLTIAAFAATMVFVAPRLGLDFFPQSDRGELDVRLEYASDYNLPATNRRAKAVAARIRKLPNVLGTMTIVGKVEGIIGQVSEGVNLAEIVVKLVPKTHRNADLETMRSRIRRILADETDCITSVLVPADIGGASKPLEMEIRGDDIAELNRLGTAAVALAEKTGKLVDIENTVREGKPEVRILPRRAVLADLQIPPYGLGITLRGNLEGIKAGSFTIGDRSFDIRVKMHERPGLPQIADFHIPTPAGRAMNLPGAARIRHDRIPLQIIRSEKRRMVKLFADMPKGVALGTAVDALRAAVQPILPTGYRLRFVGIYEKMAAAAADFRTAFITATLLTYLLLAAILESWTQPLLIMTTLPLAYMGLILGLWIAGLNMSMMGMLAGIMLIGVVVNNAILIMDEHNRLAAAGIDRREAMLRAATRKFRPILMTTIAAVLGMLPMALGNGLGSELRASCGVGAVGGIVVAGILSIFFIPMIYLTFARTRRDSPPRPAHSEGTPQKEVNG